MKKTSLLLLSLSTLWHIPGNAASFDCAKASSYAEHTVCSTSSLSELDDRLSTLYRQALAEHTDDAASIKKAQLSWLKNTRNKATTAAQLESAYTNRINDLYTLLGTKKENQRSVQPEASAPVAVKAGKNSDKPVARLPADEGKSNAAPNFPPRTNPVTKSCKVAMQYSPGAKDKYITGKKDDPHAIRVTDSGDSFVIHFDQYYGLGDMDSGSLGLLDKDYLNVRTESDGSTSYYLRPADATVSSYVLKSVKNNETQVKIIMYACKVAS
ncbi:DUF1311 domain-containing protein [Metakosakonia massiliensis]|uniref:Lysozyme inhibitor LprI-like N-terminal domain-containing protein n=1 Tax=Phytobacter massiliensis TaxID=1485952 RepID=A0A6N3E2Z6_9ENTR